MSHVFGPVPSRRLGRSLGVDLVPFKTCSFDCIYCQLGRTTDKTLERRAWVPLDAVVADLKERIGCHPDYITLSGSGEPTLYSRLGELIDAIRAMTDIPIAVLTNGSLLWQPTVRAELRRAALVIPSLDAGDAALFEAVNRPHAGLAFERIVEGLIAFRREFPGTIWLEVLLLAGYTANDAAVRRIVAIVDRIGPDRVQINTVTRPAAEAFAKAAQSAHLETLAKLFRQPVDIIEDRDHRTDSAASMIDEESILGLIRRRPCTVDDIADALRFHRVEVLKSLNRLQKTGLVERRQAGDRLFFRVASDG